MCCAGNLIEEMEACDRKSGPDYGYKGNGKIASVLNRMVHKVEFGGNPISRGERILEQQVIESYAGFGR
jgi:hypothetical protein